MNAACTDAKPGGLVFVPLPDANYAADSEESEKTFASKHSDASSANRQSSTAGDAQSSVLAALRQMRKALIDDDGMCAGVCVFLCSRAISLGSAFAGAYVFYAV